VPRYRAVLRRRGPFTYWHRVTNPAVSPVFCV
jgi:hypothetical protein